MLNKIICSGNIARKNFVLITVLLFLLTLSWNKDSHGRVFGNTSSVRLENGIPKLVINDKVINNMFSVSVYCIGVDPSNERWLSEMKKIVDRVAELKIPIMRFQMAWKDYDRSTSVPASAEEAALRFHTKNLDAILDYAAKNNVYIEIPLVFPSHWELPAWWSKYKDNVKGYQMVDAASDPSSKYNKRMLATNPIASYQSRTHRELLKAVITRLVKRYRAHPAVIGWEINPGPTGEGGYGPSYIAIRFDPQMAGLDMRTAMADYSPVAKKAFRQWLKNKYHNINALNNVWHTLYSSFIEIEPPLPKKSLVVETFLQNGDTRSAMIDWQKFRYYAMLDEWKFLSGVVKSLDKEKIVIGKPGWTPAFYQTGSERMLGTSVEMSELGLIDVEHVAAGIVAQDYQSNIPLPQYRIDYANLVEFSRGHNTASIITLENWYERDPGTRGQLISTKRAIAVKNTIKNRGGYLRIVVDLPQDSQPEGKPAWSWDEVRRLIGESKTDELKNYTIEDPSILLYHDMRNVMTHYYEEKSTVRSCRIYHQLSRALFDATNGRLKTGFISAAEVMRNSLTSSDLTRVLIMANQRVVPPDIVQQLQRFVLSGGRLLLIGSNGVFNQANKRDTSVIEKLAGELNGKQIRQLYNWGAEQVVKVPFISVTKYATDYFEVPMNGDPTINFNLLQRGLGNVVSELDNGSFILQNRKKIVAQQKPGNKISSPRNPMNSSAQGKCGDGICDEIEQGTGLCPNDCSRQREQGNSPVLSPSPRNPGNSSAQGKCGDGICDEIERQTGVCQNDCP